MKNRYKWAGLILAAIVVILIGVLVMQHRQHSQEAVTYDNTPKIGMVRLDEAIKTNPLYASYSKSLHEYEMMQAQYEAEQQTLTSKAMVEQQAMAAELAKGGQAQALEKEYQTKLALKEAQLNGQLLREYDALRQKYAETLPKANTVNLTIVNLQLALNSLNFSTPEEKAKKEQELATLLQQSDPSVVANSKAVTDKIKAAMAPKKEAAQKELAEYAQTLRKELMQKQAAKEQMTAALWQSKTSLPNPVVWNEAWHKKMEAKQAEVKGYREGIIEDIRARVATIAEEKGLSLVVSQYMAPGKATDITDAVIASYK